MKNVGEPYITQFSHNLVVTFYTVFEAGTNDTRLLMVRLLKTWPQFFQPRIIHDIEQRIQHLMPTQTAPRSGAPDGRNIHVNPNMFQRPRTTPELIKILEDTLKRTDPKVLQHPAIAPQLAQLHKALTLYATKTSPRVSPQPIVPVVAPRATSPPPASNPSDLVNTLMSLGLLGGTTAPAAKAPERVSPHNGFDSSKLPAVRQLYDSFKLQCSNCGLRFNVQGELDSHMDKHFAISSRKNKNKVLSRKWHQSEEDWIRQVDDIVVESPGAIFFSQLTEAKAPEREEPVTSDADEGVPMDPDQTKCPVCHEPFELARDSVTDEWIYKYTVRDPSSKTITHRLCQSSFLSRQRDSPAIVSSV